jgi:hypothetical protein
MFPRRGVTLFVLLVATSVRLAVAAVDLTPTPVQVDEDGAQFLQLKFKGEAGSATFVPPEKWTFRGGGARLQLTPPGTSFAEATIETVPFREPTPLDAAVIEQFKQEVLAGLPPGSQAVTTVVEAENSMMPGGNPSFELVVAYEALGKPFQRSLLLVHTPRERLVFRLTALKSDFLALSTQFRRAIMTWQWIDAKPPQGAAPAR